MATSTAHTRPITVAVHYETTIGQPPGYVKGSAEGGAAASYASDEGTNTHRMEVTEADPSWIDYADVPDPVMHDIEFGQKPHIRGIRHADGGTLGFKLYGTGATTAATNQVSETALGKLLGHCLGGHTRTYSSALTTVVSDTSYTLTTATGMDEGQTMFLADDGDSSRLFPQRVLTATAGAVTVDQTVDFTVATDDDIHGAEEAWFDPDALGNPADANASTLTVLYEKHGKVYCAAGCAAQLDSLTFETNQPPTLQVSVQATRALKHDDGAPAAPTWTGTIQGESGLHIGTDTKLFLEDVGTTTNTQFDCLSFTVNPGITKTPITTRTEKDDAMPGRAGYSFEVGQTTIEVQAILSSDWVTAWKNQTAKHLKFYQVGAAGAAWCIYAPNVFLEKVVSADSDSKVSLQTLTFVCRPDRSLDSLASNVERAQSRILISRG